MEEEYYPLEIKWNWSGDLSFYSSWKLNFSHFATKYYSEICWRTKREKACVRFLVTYFSTYINVFEFSMESMNSITCRRNPKNAGSSDLNQWYTAHCQYQWKSFCLKIRNMLWGKNRIDKTKKKLHAFGFHVNYIIAMKILKNRMVLTVYDGFFLRFWNAYKSIYFTD